VDRLFSHLLVASGSGEIHRVSGTFGDPVTAPLRFLPPLAILSLSGCSSEFGLQLQQVVAAADSDDEPIRDKDPAASGALVYVDTDSDLSSGVVISGAVPFRSLTLVMTAPADSVFSLRLPGEDGELGPWEPVVIDEDLGLYRNGHHVLPAAVDFVELRASAGASFIQAVLYEGTTPLYDDDPGTSRAAARTAEPGMWTMPADSWEIAQQQYLAYTGAESCTGVLSDGARELGDYLVEHTDATSYGGYNCREISGSSSLSVHSEGRAIDLFVPTDGSGDDSASNDLGDPIANWLAENAEYVGMSYVIWDQASWGAHRDGDKHQSYGGSHPHNDHLHIELTWDAADRLTPWFGDPDGATSGATPDGDLYTVGDWDGDGRDNLAVRRDDTVYMDTNFDGLAEIVQVYGTGHDEDAYLVGDWEGDGRDNLAVRRGATVLMDTNFDAVAELEQTYGDGASEDEYLVGDWNGDGEDDLAVRRGDTVYMDVTGDGLADIVQVYGNASTEDEYLVGDWDGDGRDNLAVRRGATVLMDTNFDGLADIQREFGDGASEDEYLVGDWDGDGRDDLAVRRGATVLMETSGDGLHDLEQSYGDG